MQEAEEGANLLVSVINSLGIEAFLVLLLLVSIGWAGKFVLSKAMELANKFLSQVQTNISDLNKEINILDDKIISQMDLLKREQHALFLKMESDVNVSLKEQNHIMIKLIDRIRMMQEDIIRLDTMFRIKHGLEVDYSKISKSDRKYEN